MNIKTKTNITFVRCKQLLLALILLPIFCIAAKQPSFVSDVIGVKETMLTPDYWQSKIPNENKLLLSETQINKQQNRLFDNSPHLTILHQMPNQMKGEDIKRKIFSISQIPSAKRYDSSGKQVSDKQFQQYIKSLNIQQLSGKRTIEFGMVVNRTDMRTFPTDDKVFKSPQDFLFDRFQETALFPTEVVAILHESLDKKWWFATAYHYSAWIKKEDIALGDKTEIFNYKKTTDFLMITGNKVFTNHNPVRNEVSQVQLEMGTKLALVAPEKIPALLDEQNTYASHVVYLPTRKSNGDLEFSMALIARNQDVHKGYLPYTEKNILSQSFKFLGERYGWGHSFNARDCTGFVGEIYKSFGILMPRNSGQQGNSDQGTNFRFNDETSREDKLKIINQLQIGDLIYLPGHVAMYIGKVDNEPYIIHDVAGLSYYTEDKQFYQSKLNGVSVTPLLPLHLNASTSYLDKIYAIKKIR